MATFSAKNFPSNVGNNKSFSGIGERTTYVPISPNMSIYRYGDGFRPEKKTNLYTKEGYIKKTIDRSNKVFFTYPAKLYNDLGERKGIFAEVSLESPKSSPDGLVLISHIIKPKGSNQERVDIGAKRQKSVARKVEKIANDNQKQYKFISTATRGSRVPDLVVEYDGNKLQFEIKGSKSANTPVALFDKSVNRRSPTPEIIDEIANIFIEPKLKKEGIETFLQLIDYIRLTDTTVGLAGDQGVTKSGKMPSMFTTRDTAKLEKLHKIIQKYYKTTGDHYLVVFNNSSKKYDMYFTGLGKNYLDCKSIPKFSYFSMSTYGGASSGSTRVALKIKLR